MHKVKLIRRNEYFPAPDPEGEILVRGNTTIDIPNTKCSFSETNKPLSIEIDFYDFPYIDYEHDDRTLTGVFISGLQFVCCIDSSLVVSKNSPHLKHKIELEKEVGHPLENNLHRLFDDYLSNDNFRYTFNDVVGWLEIIDTIEAKKEGGKRQLTQPLN